MKKISIKCLAASLLVLTGLASCTLSEPDESKNAGGRLESISLMGMNYLSLKYDSQGRITEYSDQLGGTLISVSYDPIVIRQQELDTYYDDERDKEVAFVRDETIFTNVSCNSMGYITSCLETENRYSYISGSYTQNSGVQLTETDTYKRTFTYDSNGHLIKSLSEDGEVTSLVWEDGLLMSITDDDSSIEYQYDGVENIWLQWIPFWYAMGGLEMTNLFGVAPEKLITYIYDEDEDRQFAYKLNSAEQVSAIKFDGLTLNFNYKIIK